MRKCNELMALKALQNAEDVEKLLADGQCMQQIMAMTKLCRETVYKYAAAFFKRNPMPTMNRLQFSFNAGDWIRNTRSGTKMQVKRVTLNNETQTFTCMAPNSDKLRLYFVNQYRLGYLPFREFVPEEKPKLNIPEGAGEFNKVFIPPAPPKLKPIEPPPVSSKKTTLEIDIDASTVAAVLDKVKEIVEMTNTMDKYKLGKDFTYKMVITYDRD